jgi:L-ascorbate metabolism protein UlaG (beta-lactamase superfamily)
MGAHLERWGIRPAQFTELDWNESVRHKGLRATALPARHFSGRNPLRAYRVLWASWAIEGPRHRVYFSGDTGYSDAFARIGQEHGPFDLTMIKIGAYDRAWPDIHINPEEAVRAHRELRGRRMLAVHWATFNLGIHAWSEPPERLLVAAQNAGAHVLLPRPGEVVNVNAPPPVDPWWRAIR